MLFLVDIGNTRIKSAQFESDYLSNHHSFVYRVDNLSQLLDQAWGAIDVPAAVYLANVGQKEIEVAISNWINQKWGCQIHFIKSIKSAMGVTNGYDFPEKLGVDRWLAIIAAYQIFKTDVCIFDCGTAITMDLVNANGVHQGGLIFPGVSLLQTSLLSNTAGCASAKLNDLNIKNQLVATNTNDGVQLGCVNAVLSILNYQRIRLAEEFDLIPTFVITGGDALFLISALPSGYHHVPDLVLQGVSLIAKNNI